MVLLHVVTKKEFPVEGELKRLWHKVGIIRAAKNGRMFLHLYHAPNVDFYLFEPKDDHERNLPTIPYDETDADDEEDYD